VPEVQNYVVQKTSVIAENRLTLSALNQTYEMIPPIAMLHHVSDDPAHDSLGGWKISRGSFLRLLDHIESNGYQTITFHDLEKKAGPGKKIILSFDDCPRNLFDFVIPELQRRRMKAAFYMPTAYLGKHNAWDVEEGRAKVELMNEADILALDRLGMEVGAHGHEHVALKKIDNMFILEREISLPKKILEDILGKKIISFSYPFASVPANYQKLLSGAGYRFGLSIYQPIEHRLALRRFGYYDIDDNKRIGRKLSILYKVYRRFTDPVTKH
jgi:peptidoglycan/xylan/chitin deacetylase (PgdA/CDA1 family)